MSERWVLLVLDDPQLRELYVRLLERRGYRVHATHCPDEARRLVHTDYIDLAVIDVDLDGLNLSTCLGEWFSSPDDPALVLLVTSTPSEDRNGTAISSPPRADVDLVLKKPLSPMEFGIQVDHLLETQHQDSTLEDTSEVERQFDAIQREFALQLHEDIDSIHQRWRDLVDTSDAPTDEARQLLHIVARMRKAARHFGFATLCEYLQDFASFLTPLTAKEGVLDADAVETGLARLSALRECCQNNSAIGRNLVAPFDGDDSEPTILVIEPQATFAQSLVRHVDVEHSTVHCVSIPDSLVDCLEEYRPDLLILSARLRKVSCFDVCRTIRSISRWQPLPVVVVTEHDSPETRLAAFQSGADDVVSKDIDPDELRARLIRHLERIRLHRKRADRDLLTGLLTRRAFVEQLTARLSEAERHDRSLVFCLIDVDHFKRVNDRYGHPIGDRVLEALGELLGERFRIEDLRARWGGEEFAVVLLDEDAATARRALDRVRGEFSDIAFTSDDGEIFHVTFSAGIAEFGSDGTDADSLLTAADTRLLRAKRAGRDTILTGRG